MIPSRTLPWSIYYEHSKLLGSKLLSIFKKKSSIVDARLGSKTPLLLLEDSFEDFKRFISLKFLQYKILQICDFFKVLLLIHQTCY